MKKFYLISLAFTLFLNASSQVLVNIPASQDNTIYNDETDNSNGNGDNFTTGRNSQGNIRRGLIKFNLSSIPPGSTINAVTLTLFLNKSKTGTDNVFLNKMISNWGEGTSFAGGDSDGQGASATTNDATWVCSFASGTGSCNTSWSLQGGDFTGTVSATVSIPNDVGAYAWSSAQMIADVQAWVNNASTNFGWIVRTNEGSNQTTNRFSSRTHPTTGERPNLFINYTLSTPVTLISFNGQETKYGNALSWETAQEINNAFFSIEHSTDGIHYSSIGKITGAGTTSIPQSYKFLHSAPGAGQHYYRLAQTDIDAKINYSHIVAISLHKSIYSILINPNPVKDKIVLHGFSPGKRTYMIFDLVGQKILQGTISNEIRIPPTLSQGTYYLRIVAGDGQVFTGNFLKQ